MAFKDTTERNAMNYYGTVKSYAQISLQTLAELSQPAILTTQREISRLLPAEAAELNTSMMRWAD